AQGGPHAGRSGRPRATGPNRSAERDRFSRARSGGAVMSTRLLHDCFAVHRKLAGSAILLARRLGSWGQEADQLRLGASCVQIAAERALAAHSEREAILGWSECELGDRQIRGATYRALAAGQIGNGEY